MASGQDPLDKWNTHEKFCLASVVSNLGDQNWIDISRNMKILCEKNTEGLRRPSDWYSEKSCALQYAQLLENGEGTDKKNASSSEGNPSPATVVKSTLKLLKDKRMQELQEQIRKDQQEYAEIHAALQKLKSPNKTLKMLQDMWREVEKEQEAKRITEMKWENELREREQRNQKSISTTTNPTPTVKQESTLAVDMDVEEIIGVSKQTATSPLLSSLLKSPTATAPPPPLSNITSSARTTAPTITTLLTSGTIPKSNQPAITLNTDLIPPEKAVQLLSRPISGPPSADSLNVSNTATLNLLSPSKSAPTLSMLLEKKKPLTNTGINPQVSDSKDEDKSTSKFESKSDDKPKEYKENDTPQISEVENNSDEPDPNEEQQLMEVFKNIGNIEIDIDVAAVINDEEVDFLKSADDDESPQAVQFESKTDEKHETTPTETKVEEKKTENINKESTELKNEIRLEEKPIKMETSSDDSNDNIPLAVLENKERIAVTPTENEAKASENSPKSTIESTGRNSENKSPIVKPDKEEIIEKLNTKETEEKQKENLETVKSEKIEKIDAAELKCEDEIKQQPNDEEKVTGVGFERVPIATGDENISEKELETVEKPSVVDEDGKADANAVDNSTSIATIRNEELIETETESNSDSKQVQENANANETTLPPPPPSQISIPDDTDEDSCMTDISVLTTTTVKREERQTTQETRHKSDRAASQTRRDVSSKSTEDSDSSGSHRASKRSLLGILNNLSTTKSAQTIQQALINDENMNLKYHKTCYKRLDFQTIKKNIENGSISSFIDLQRDLLHYVQNVNFLFHSTSPTYKAAEVFRHEMQNVREFVFNAHEFEAKSEKEIKEIKQAATTKQGRTGSRKSLRIS